MKLDPATGLPELPAKHFWKVWQGSAFVYISIHKKGMFSTSNSKELGRSAICSLRHLNKERILEEAKSLYREWQNRHEKNSLLGCYPPNKLRRN